MEQVTTLRLAIDSRDAVKAQKDLDNLAKSSTVTEKAASNLSRAIGAIGFAAMATEAVRTADAMNRLDGRLRLATESTAEYTAQWKELADVAERSRAGLSETITLFTKLNPAIKQLGGDTAATNAVVEAFSKSLKVGGASSAESASAILQFAQAMGSGVLRGEEFNAIFEASAKTMDYLAKGMGVPVTEMRKLAQEGELTAGKVAAAMLKMTEHINSDFGTIPLTVGDALTQAKNELSIFILETDKAFGITQSLAGGITDSVAAVKSAVGVYQEYSNVINGVAVAAGVLLTAQKAAAVTEAALTAARARNTVTTTAYDAALMRTVTTTSTLTTAQTLSAAAAGALGTALKAVPFLAVAGVVAALAYSFFDAKSKSDDLNDSLNATAESLGNLTKAQLEYKRTNLSLELQSVGVELRQLQQEYDKTSGRTVEQQKEIDDLKTTYNALLEASKNVATAQTALREGKKATAAETKKENLSIEEQIKLLEKNSAATKKVTAAKKELSDVEKARLDAIRDNAEREADAALSVYRATQDALQDNADREAEAALQNYETGLYWDRELTKGKLANISAVTLARQEAEEKAAADALHKWDGFFDDLDKAMENQLFDAMVGKWDSFGDWLKDFWSSLVSSIARAASSQLSDSLISGLRGGFSEGGIAQNLIKALSGAAAGVGTTLSAGELSTVSQMAGTWSQAGSTNLITAGGSVISAGGQILKAGADVSSLVSVASNLKTAYGLITSGLETTVAPYIEGLGNFLQATNFNIGGTQVGLGAGVLGGIGGYGAGLLGDKLFGADTKASTFGSIGGALGAAFGGPVGFAIGAGLGSVIGGMFGKTKTTGSGLSFAGMATGEFQDVMSYTDYQKKSWFSSKSWTTFAELSQAEKKKIDSIFDSYDYLLTQLGATKSIFLEAGKYSGQTFVDQLAKNFIRIVSTAGDDAAIYRAWKEYADSVNSTMTEAFGDVVAQMVTGKRTFSEWMLGKGTIEQISYTASYLQSDFEMLAKSLDATSVNVANFQKMYDMAIAANFTPENIAQWNALGEALMSASDAQKRYTEALEAQEASYAKMLADAAIATDRAGAAITATVDALQRTFKSLRATTKSLVDSLSTGKGGTADVRYYLKQYHELKKSFMSAFDPETGLVYSDSVQAMESAYNELAGVISALSSEGIGDARRASLLNEIGVFDALFAKNEDIIQKVTLVGAQGDSLENGATQQTQENIEQWLRSLYEVQAEAKAANVAPLSAASFEAGHTLGTQEQIDFARVTGLTIGSSAFNSTVSALQGFSTASDPAAYLSSLIAGGDIATVSALTALGGNAPALAVGALSALKSTYSAQSSDIETINRNNAAEAAWDKYDKAIKMMEAFYAGGFDVGSGHGSVAWQFLTALGLPVDFGIRYSPDKAARLSAFKSAAMDAYNKEINSLDYIGGGAMDVSALARTDLNPLLGQHWGWSINDLSGLTSAEMAKIADYQMYKNLLGFSIGGYTGDAPTNAIAGTVHGQEYVVNAKTTRDLGLNGQSGLFKQMAGELSAMRAELSEMRQYAVTQTATAVKSLNVNRAILGSMPQV